MVTLYPYLSTYWKSYLLSPSSPLILMIFPFLIDLGMGKLSSSFFPVNISYGRWSIKPRNAIHSSSLFLKRRISHSRTLGRFFGKGDASSFFFLSPEISTPEREPSRYTVTPLQPLFH